MDVEGSEIQAIEAMYHDGVLDKIKQIGVEVCRIREIESKVLNGVNLIPFKKYVHGMNYVQH